MTLTFASRQIPRERTYIGTPFTHEAVVLDETGEPFMVVPGTRGRADNVESLVQRLTDCPTCRRQHLMDERAVLPDHDMRCGIVHCPGCDKCRSSVYDPKE